MTTTLRYHSDMLYPTIPCVGCGYCCRKAPCARASSNQAPCVELVEVDGIWRCGKFLRLDGEAKRIFMEDLGIGAGCCSPLNTDRRKYMGRT
jgi:hypothetical protein